MTEYRELPAPPSLRLEVECGWLVRAPGAPRPQRVLPDGCMDLLWMAGEIVVAGPDSAAHIVLPPPGTTTTGLRLHPGVVPGLLGVPAAALRDQRVPLAELAPAAARQAADRIAAGAAPLSALAALAHELRAGTGSPDPGLRAAAGLLGRGGSIAATAATLGWTARSLHRRCEAGFGYGPAVLRRILRFRAALRLAHAGVPAAEAAARTGYADQPHLSREVRALAGVPLGQLLAGSGANRSTPLPSGSTTTA